jgi:hypothetical protein
MSQSRKRSAIEAWTNTIVGIVLNMTGTHFVLAAMGLPFSWNQNIILTAVMVVLSTTRSYTIRRLFAKGE